MTSRSTKSLALVLLLFINQNITTAFAFAATAPYGHSVVRAVSLNSEDAETSARLAIIEKAVEERRRALGTMWSGSSNHGEDYGIAW
jgi:hypothetical protein